MATQVEIDRQKELRQRTIALPSAESLSDVLVGFAQCDCPSPQSPRITLREFPAWSAGSWSDPKGEERTYFSGRVSIVANPGYRLAWATVTDFTPAVWEYIEQNVLFVSWDTMYVEISMGADGRAYVYLRHNQIIGSHILAIIDAASVPVVFEDEE